MTTAVLNGTMLRLRTLLPAGTPLPDEDWAIRHATISNIAMLHAPAIFLLNLVLRNDLVHVFTEVLPIAVFSLMGRRTSLSRGVREMSTSLALTISSAALVHASGGLIEAHFHFFVVVALVTLYQQWRPFALAILFVLIHHGVAGMIDPASVYNHEAAINSPWVWAGVHAAFIAMATAVGMANWKFNETARGRAETYYGQLYDGKAAIINRLREADQVKSELVAAVSHEFRTPLTAILGFLSTMERNPDLTAEQRADMTVRAVRQARRLERLVINLLEAERPLDLAEGTCDATETVEGCVREIRESQREPVLLDVDVTPGLVLPMARAAAALILDNLVTNALRFSDRGSLVKVRCRRTQAGGVSIEVANRGPAIPTSMMDVIFEPFTQVDSSDTREVDGVGLGLHLVKRAVSAHGGVVEVTCHWGITTFVVELPSSVNTTASASLDAIDVERVPI